MGVSTSRMILYVPLGIFLSFPASLPSSVGGKGCWDCSTVRLCKPSPPCCGVVQCRCGAVVCGVIGLVMGEWGVCGGKNARGRGGRGMVGRGGGEMEDVVHDR